MLRRVACLLALLVLVVIGCRRTDQPKPPVIVTPKPNPVEEAAEKFTNGLDDKDRSEFYHLAEGSEVFPLDWIKVLEDKDTGKPFLEGLEQIGFIPDPANSDGLHVGLTANVTRGMEPLGKMVGINCAACHVGELTYKGQAMRIDGAPNVADTRTFFASLVESAIATIEDPDKLLAFLGRLNESRVRPDQEAAVSSKIRARAVKVMSNVLESTGTAGNVKAHMRPLIKKLVEKEQAAPPLDLSPGAKQTPTEFRERILGNFKADVFKSTIGKEVAGVVEHLVAMAENEEGSVLHMLDEIYIGARLLRARVVYLKKLGMIGKDPRTVWGPGRVDAFGSARAFLFQEGYLPLSPVSYPHIWNFDRVAWLHYDGNTTSVVERNMGQALGVGAVYDPKSLSSTLVPANLNRLEQLAGKITPPAWPEKLLGKIDREKVQRGAKLFEQHCLKCHPILKPNEDTPDLLYAPEEVLTDRLRADTFAEKLPEGPFKGEYFFAAIRDTMSKIKVKSYEDNGITPEQQKEFEKDRPVSWRGPDKYAGRPLVAIWATGPYLHNGSVPTLDDLLKPAKDRPATFFVGSREYDPEKLGYVTHVDGKKDNFDTSTPGNRNIGHEYGTSLSQAERQDLLEYLKAN